MNGKKAKKLRKFAKQMATTDADKESLTCQNQNKLL